MDAATHRETLERLLGEVRADIAHTEWRRQAADRHVELTLGRLRRQAADLEALLAPPARLFNEAAAPSTIIHVHQARGEDARSWIAEWLRLWRRTH